MSNKGRGKGKTKIKSKGKGKESVEEPPPMDIEEDTETDLRHWKSPTIERGYIIAQLKKFHGYDEEGKIESIENMSKEGLIKLIVKHLKDKKVKADPTTIVRTKILKKKPVR